MDGAPACMGRAYTARGRALTWPALRIPSSFNREYRHGPELYTRTNQKLYFAGLALEAWKRADAERAMNAQAIIQGSASRRCSTFMAQCSVYAMRSPVTTVCRRLPLLAWMHC